MSLCSYTEKNLVHANLHQMARHKEGGGTHTEAVIRSFKWQTHYVQRPEGLRDSVSCQRAFWLSQAHRHSYVSQGSWPVLATDTESVRKQKGCLGDVAEGWRGVVQAKQPTTDRKMGP